MKWLLWFAVGFIAAASLACRIPTESLTMSCYHDSDCPKYWTCNTQKRPGTCVLHLLRGDRQSRRPPNQPEVAQRREGVAAIPG